MSTSKNYFRSSPPDSNPSSFSNHGISKFQPSHSIIPHFISSRKKLDNNCSIHHPLPAFEPNHNVNDNIFESSSHTSFDSSLLVIYESKFKHLKNSRFTSTSIMFRDRSKKSSSSASKSSSNNSTTYPPPSSFGFKLHHSSIESDDSLPHLSKEIKGPNKTLDLPSRNNILKKTLESYKTYRSSYLGNATRSKSKVPAAKHFKSFRTSRTKLVCPTYLPCSTFPRTPTSTSPDLENGEQPLYPPTSVVSLFIVLLIFIFSIKLLHRPFDRGKGTKFVISLH